MIRIKSSEELLTLIQNAIPQVQGQLRNPEKLPEHIYIEDFQIILSELQRINQEIVSSQVPDKRRRWVGIGRVIVDAPRGAWSYPGIASLKDVLLAIADYYKRKL